MTQLLQKALEQLHQLPQDEQDAIAAVILEELQDEGQWQAALEQSQEQLGALAREALAEHWAGHSKPLDLSY